MEEATASFGVRKEARGAEENTEKLAHPNLYSCGKDEKTASMMRPLIRGIRRGI